MRSTYELLCNFLAEGYYLHGSPLPLTVLKPQQAKCITGRVEACQVAVYAEDKDVRIPCIKGMLTKIDPNLPSARGYSTRAGPLVVSGYNARLCPAFVHVVLPDTFYKINAEVLSYKEVRVLTTVRIVPQIVECFPDTKIQIPY